MKWIGFFSFFICACGSGVHPKPAAFPSLGPSIRAQDIEQPVDYHVGDVAKFEVTLQTDGGPQEFVENRTIEILSVSEDQLVIHFMVTRERIIRGQTDILSYESKRIRISNEQKTYHNLIRSDVKSNLEVCNGCAAVELRYSTAKWLDSESYEKTDWDVIVVNSLPSFARKILSCETRTIDLKLTKKCQKLISFHST